MRFWKLIGLPVIALAALGAYLAVAAPISQIGSSVQVCDPNAPTHCAAPDGSGNLPVVTNSGSTTTVTGDPQVSGYEAHIAITPTVQNASYVSGNCLGGFNAITVAQTNGQGLFVTNFRLTSLGGSTPSVTVYLFDANPSASTCTDKSTFTLNSADVDKLIATPFTVTLAAPTGTTITFGNVANMGRPFMAGGSAASGVKTIYVGLVSGTTFTPGSTTDIHEDIGVAG